MNNTAFLLLIIFVFVASGRSWFPARQKSSWGRLSWKDAGVRSSSNLMMVVSSANGSLSEAALTVRGGESKKNEQQTSEDTTRKRNEEEKGHDDDSERYSRQVYTLGARAHGLIRSSTVYLDGPPSSGLVYECGKNLALSGIRHLVIVRSDDDTTTAIESQYHLAALDDLGQAYQRAARAELEEHVVDEDVKTLSDEDILAEYLRRLNPNIVVTVVDRSDLLKKAKDNSKEEESVGRRVLLCMDRPTSSQSILNQLARQKGWLFVSAETAGVFGRIFCDFGSNFEVYDADGETPLVTPLDRLEQLLPEERVVVHSVEGEKHDVSKGDRIEFQLRNGNVVAQQCEVTLVKTPFQFEVKLLESSSSSSSSPSSFTDFVAYINENAASFRRVKVSQHISFQSLEDALDVAQTDASLFTASDLEKSFDGHRRAVTMACFQALPTFVQEHGRYPSLDDLKGFQQLAKTKWPLTENDVVEGSRHFKSLLKTCAAKFSPFQAVFGAIGAQEAIKAATGLYFPVRQFLVYDCDEILDGRELGEDDTPWTTAKQETCAASGLRYILGDETVDELQNHRIFIVGAGAIGCELLKNLGAMGVASGDKGSIVLTDMDTIEKSNLSRQLLFRDSNIGQFKSIAAQQAALRFNPSMRIEAHSSKVGGDGHSPFDERFWAERVDTVLNALDNVEARLYMDGRCVAYQKALVDAGTMGPKGNVQVVVPHQSESYASSVDPPEPTIAVCTLKNFPYAISHTIQWGRELFDDLFNRRPDQANRFAELLPSSNPEALAARLLTEKDEESALDVVLELSEDLRVSGDGNEENVLELSLDWAANLAYKYFFEAPKELLSKHPLDSLDEDGEPFWSGARRPPKALVLDLSSKDPEQKTINDNLISFVRATARLRHDNLHGSDFAISGANFSIEGAKNALENRYSGGTEPRSMSDKNNSSQDEIAALLEEIKNSSLRQSRMTPLEFEKDDDSNGHVAFITAASNLRAICYGIPPVDAMETRRVAGNIVPAMITTTAFVSALSCIELVKLSQRKPLQAHRNAFINLALPFFAFTVPLPAEEVRGVDGKTYTFWDRLVVNESRKAASSGGITLKSFLRKIKKQVTKFPDQIDVASVSCGPFMLFASFLHGEDDEVLNTPLWRLILEAFASNDEFETEFSGRDEPSAMNEVPMDNDSCELAVVVEDLETGEEIELPTVHFQRYKEQ